MSGTLICGRNTATDTIVPVEVNADGTLEMTAEISTAGLATEAKQDDMITDLTQIATNTERLAPQLNRTEAIPVQIMVGSGGANYDALRANGQDLMVMIDDMNPDVAVNSGLSTSTKQDTMITHLADIDNQTAKISKGSGVISAGGELQQVLLYGKKDDTTLQPLECSGDRLLVDVVELNLSGPITTSTALSSVQVCGYDTVTSQFKTLKVDSNGVLETSGGGGGGGDATAANQTLQLAQETIIAGDTTSLDSKITQGYDSQIVAGGSGLQQNLCYGLDTGGNLDALRVDNSGHLEVTVDDFVKGQDTMTNSFPVVIASDQSAVATSSAQLPASLGQKANASSISICRSTTAGAFDMSARTTIATAGTSTKLLCDSNGVLQIQPLRDAVATAISTTNVLANGTFTSASVNMNGFSELMVIGSTTNLSDSMYWEFSFDNATFFKGQEVYYDFSTGDFAVLPSTQAPGGSTTGMGGAQYMRITQTDTTASAFSVQFASSKR